MTPPTVVREKQIRRLNFELKSFDDDDRSFMAIASNDQTDRHGESINQEGWDLANFKSNPVVPWGHDYSQPPVAQATEVEVKDGKLMFRPKFATAEEYSFADTIYRLYKGGYLRAFSVGFMPNKWTEDDEGNFVWDEQELLEISAVTVPANPGALALAVKEGVLNEDQRKEMVGHLKDVQRSLETAEKSPAVMLEEATKMFSKISKQLDALTAASNTNDEGKTMADTKSIKAKAEALAASLKDVDSSLLSQLLEDLHTIDVLVDQWQPVLATVLGVPNPDDDDEDEEDALKDSGKTTTKDEDGGSDDDAGASANADNEDAGADAGDNSDASADDGASDDNADEEVDEKALTDEQAEQIKQGALDKIAKENGKID